MIFGMYFVFHKCIIACQKSAYQGVKPEFVKVYTTML